MTIDVYSATGAKKGTATLPKALFEVPVNQDLMHQAVVRQQSNRRAPIAHVKSRGEVQGSTRKLFRQKGTGRARRGSIRAPLLRGGGKAFGPRNTRNFIKNMPRKMRRAALFSSLTAQAQNNTIIGLEGYDADIKTKTLYALLPKLPVDIGRKILFVVPERNEKLYRSSRNVQGVKTVTAGYLNPEDILGARHIIFVGDALKKAEEVFATEAPAQKEAAKKEPAKKAATKKETAKQESESAEEASTEESTTPAA